MSGNKIHLFNPEIDLALGLGCRHYTPPPHAAALHRAGALLPAWWARPEDTILAPSPTADDDARWIMEQYGLHVNPVTVADNSFTPAPWGWSADARRQFSDAGVGARSLPDDGTLDRMRNLSHRRTSVEILTRLGREDLPVMELTVPDEAVRFEAEYPGSYYKSPWSCSGRGVFCARGLSEKVLHEKCAGIIHRQGSVMAERGYDKVSEFGALFDSHDGGVRFIGLSMFVTEPRGAYTGNIVASQSYFQDRIDSLGLTHALGDAISGLETILTDIAGHVYTGPLGVDMMAYRDTDGGIRLHPCIELNLRMTMGIAAMHVAGHLCPSRPMLMGWRRGAPADGDVLLLPPREGFALTIHDFNDNNLTLK
ncbi:MAG: hypothetical protein K2K77_05765 [Duncaniella sp.]|nr:hypothetical protein [Duncaniella sp.]